MDAFTLEISAHRIGGAEFYGERTWGPWCVQMSPDYAWQRHSIPGRTRSNVTLDVSFERPWVPVRPGLISTQVTLMDVTGQTLTTSRAVLLSTLPSDVPLYAAFVGCEADAGVFSLGLRIPQSAWTPEHLAVIAEDAETSPAA